jgi:stalled ribosome alternative rescue factor ArfA
MKQRSPHAQSLADRKYRQRIVVARKGTGSYKRQRVNKEQSDVRQGS